MARFKLPARTARLLFEGEEWTGAEVKVKFDLPIGTLIRLQALARTPDDLTEMCQIIAGFLVEWNIEDDAGPLPATYEGLLRASPAFLVKFCEEWIKAQIEVPAPLEAPSTNGRPSVEESIPMESLSESRPP